MPSGVTMPGQRVQVCVVEARKHRGALRVDHRRLRALQAGDLALAADAQDLVAADRHRFGHRAIARRRCRPARCG